MERSVTVGRGIGLKRKSYILETLEVTKTMTLEQIADLCFSSLAPEARRVKARKYMLDLYKEKKVARGKAVDFNGQYTYWLEDRKHRSWEQHLWVNEVFRLFPAELKNKQLKHEFNFGNLRMDGAIRVVKDGKPYLVAIEIDNKSHEFDKVQLYNREYSAGRKIDMVIILTHRLKLVDAHIKKENSNNLNFIALRFGEVGKICQVQLNTVVTSQISLSNGLAQI